MKNKVFLEVEDFNNRLNLNFFTNLEKGITEEQLQKAYPSEHYLVFERPSVEKWINNVYASTGGEIRKGGFNDTPEVEDKLMDMKEKIDLMKSIQVQGDGDLGIRTVYVLEKALVSEEQDLLQKSKDSEDTLEKGKVDDMVNYSDLKITFKKTGAEIKEKLESLEAIERAKLNEIQVKMEVLANTLEHKPTEKYYNSDTDDMPLSYKYEMTYAENKDISSNNVLAVSDDTQACLTSDQCAGYRQWNDLCYNYRDVQRELKTIELLEDNLEDDSVFELSARQMFTLGF